MSGAFDHLLGLDGLDAAILSRLLDTARSFREVSERTIKKVPTLRGTTVMSFFVEPSTRTKLSFDVAAKRLSADTYALTASTSSLVKGETLLDTARNLEAMRPDILIIRHKAVGAAHFLSTRIDAHVVNAGDGPHEHPTQGLLDMLTMLDHKGTLRGLDVAIVGDIAHSRVARSNCYGLTTLGANVRVAGPRTMLPLDYESLGVRCFDRIEPAIEGADVVMMLRIQKERQEAGLFPSDHEYFRYFGLTRERLRLAKADAIVMHPGPMNRGVEIAPDVADGSSSVILEQVTNGIAVRMAVLFHLMTGTDKPRETWD